MQLASTRRIRAYCPGGGDPIGYVGSARRVPMSAGARATLWFAAYCRPCLALCGAVGPSLGLGLAWTALAVALGAASGAVGGALLAVIGSRLGVPFAIQTRAQCGVVGAAWPNAAAVAARWALGLLDLLLVCGWVREATGVPAEVAIPGAALGVAALAGIGPPRLMRLARLGVAPGSASLAAAWLVWSHAGALPLAMPAAWSDDGFAAQLLASFALASLGGFAASDWSRFTPRSVRRRSIAGAYLMGAVLASVTMATAGAALHAAADGGGHPAACLGAALLCVPCLGGMAMALSGATPELVALADCLRPGRDPRRVASLAPWTAAAAWAGLAMACDAETGARLLRLVEWVAVPWPMVPLVDYFIVRRGRYAVADLFDPSGVYGAWRWRGLVAWLAGCLAGGPFLVLGDMGAGPIAAALGGLDLASVVGCLVTLGLYRGLRHSHDPRREFPAVVVSRALLDTHDAPAAVADA